MKLLTAKKPKPDNREYTIMIVPHQGQSVFSIRIPIKMIKYAAAVVGICVLVLGGTFFNYRHTASMAVIEKNELDQLRDVNGKQRVQIEELAKNTANLQADMDKLNQLDAEIRRMLNSEEPAGVSRSAPLRISSGHNGRGGPNVKPDIQELTALVSDLQNSVRERQNSLAELQAELLAKQQRQAAIPSIWPAGGDVTSRFGWRSSPWGSGGDWHPGIDIASSYGAPVVAAADGVVVQAGWNDGGYGNLVTIDHGNGIVTLYGHNSQIAVREGQTVKKGDVICYMGSTGLSTGTHLHYEVRVNGKAVNPANFLQ